MLLLLRVTVTLSFSEKWILARIPKSFVADTWVAVAKLIVAVTNQPFLWTAGVWPMLRWGLEAGSVAV